MLLASHYRPYAGEMTSLVSTLPERVGSYAYSLSLPSRRLVNWPSIARGRWHSTFPANVEQITGLTLLQVPGAAFQLPRVSALQGDRRAGSAL